MFLLMINFVRPEYGGLDEERARAKQRIREAELSRSDAAHDVASFQAGICAHCAGCKLAYVMCLSHGPEGGELRFGMKHKGCVELSKERRELYERHYGGSVTAELVEKET